MFTENGALYPNPWAICKHNAIEQNLLQSERRTNVYANTNNEHWIVSDTKLDKNRSSFIGSKYIETTANTIDIYNEENNGLVFGFMQQYYDPKQYDWV